MAKLMLHGPVHGSKGLPSMNLFREHWYSKWNKKKLGRIQEPRKIIMEIDKNVERERYRRKLSAARQERGRGLCASVKTC